MVDGYTESKTYKLLGIDLELNGSIPLELRNFLIESNRKNIIIPGNSWPVAVKNQKDKDLNIQKIKDYHLKKLEQFSLFHIGDIPQTDEPTEEQKRWVLQKLRKRGNEYR
jgi:hypothetical protein